MANHYLFFLLVLIVSMTASLNGTNSTLLDDNVQYFIVTGEKSSTGQDRFYHEIGTGFTFTTLDESTQFIWRTLQQNNTQYRKPNIDAIRLFLEEFSGIAYLDAYKIYINTYYIGNFVGDVKKEFKGILYHMNAKIWQWDGNGMAPSGLVQGIADFVRLKAGLIPRNWTKPGGGNKWDEGYDITARFLDYCNGLRNGFVAELNQMMKDSYSDHYFLHLLGKNVDQLWYDYKAEYAY